MNGIFEQIAESLHSGESVEFVMVVESDGSTPRESGAAMAVCGGGKVYGTIGGGNVEFQSQKLAEQALKEKRSFLHYFDLSSVDKTNLGMLCGGDTKVLFAYLDAQNGETVSLFDSIVELRCAGQRGWFIAEITDQGDLKMVLCKYISDSFEHFPSFSGSDARVLMTSKPVFNKIGKASYFAQPLTPMARVYIYGAGHISFALVPLLSTVGFETVVYDDRGEYANAERFPQASRLIVKEYDNVLEETPIKPQDYVVILTRGHKYDYDVLAQTLRTNPFYIGMVGSRAKIKANFDKLLADDGYTEDDLKQVHSPIGLKIGAETPEEIAISIAAELIQARFEGSKTNK